MPTAAAIHTDPGRAMGILTTWRMMDAGEMDRAEAIDLLAEMLSGPRMDRVDVTMTLTKVCSMLINMLADETGWESEQLLAVIAVFVANHAQRFEGTHP